MAMADLSEHYKLETVGTLFGVSYATLSSAEGFSTTMSIVRKKQQRDTRPHCSFSDLADFEIRL